MMQTEAFGNASLFVVADDIDQVGQVLAELEGNLTGCFYTSTTGEDDAAYDQTEPLCITFPLVRSVKIREDKYAYFCILQEVCRLERTSMHIVLSCSMETREKQYGFSLHTNCED